MTERRSSPKKPALVGAERAFRAASVFFAINKRFSLAAAIFGHPLRRDHWIEKLITELEKEKVHLTHCRVPAEGEPRLLEAVTSHLAAIPTTPGFSRSVVVSGISQHLPDAASPLLPGSPTPRFLAQANFDRELFPQSCPHPLLLCVTLTSLGQFARFAPDLWHWCAHTFDFSETALPVGSQPVRDLIELEETGAGSVYANKEELERAAGIFRAGLDAAIAAYGPEHRETIVVRGKLANVFQQLGWWGEALKLTQENMLLVDKLPGLPAIEIARLISDHARALHTTNHFEEAEQLLRQALAMDEESYGTNHPVVANRLNNLAVLLVDTKRAAEAEHLMRRALGIDEANFGVDHPTVAIRLGNLAAILHDIGRSNEAEELMQRALAISETHLGSTHPDVAIRLSNLANLLCDTNRFAEAEPLARRALAIEETNYGNDHPNVAIRLNVLSSVLAATGRRAEAETLSRRAVEILLKSSTQTGHQHRHLIDAANAYAALLVKNGESKENARKRIDTLTAEYGVSLV